MTSTPISTQDGVAGRSLPAVLLVVAACLLAWLETGSIDAADWLLYAIFAALLLALVFISGSAIAPSRLALVGLGALTGFAAWQAISSAWSPLPSLARDDALLTLFYVAALSIGLFTIRTRLDGVIATCAVAAGTGTLAVATGVAVRYGSDPGRYLVGDGRLAWPITYPNAAAAMFLVGLWPALLVAAERRLPVLVRGLALGSAAAVLAAWLMTQSKGGGIALAVSAVVVLAVVPDRLRLLVPILIAAALVAPQFGPLTAPFNADATLAHVGRHAGFTLLWLTAAAVVAGVVYALVDRRVEVPARARRAAGVLALAVVVATVIAVPVAFFATVDHPGGYFGDRWRSFKHAPRDEFGRTHFISLGSNRYDFWRVALVEFRDHPLAGIGERGFGPAYLVERRSGETPVRAHSIELDALSELGIVGLVLLAAGLFPFLLLCFRGLRRRNLAATAAFATAAYWLVHASADWIWTVPAVGLPFFLLLGAGAASAGARTLRRREWLPAAVVAIAVAVLAFAPPWLSSRLSAHALEGSSSAASDLRWARRLDALSVQPYETQAHIAPTPAAAIPPLRKAARKEPRAVEVRFELGLAYLAAKRPREARRELRAALRLEPGSESIERALRSVPPRQ
jgi:O-antigen ligase/polysaccharide polymerase Wzy-like membrane protein